jgi:hypothetical protein
MTIDPRERYSDPEEVMRMAIASASADMWCAGPGIIQSYNAVAGTVVVQPATKSNQTQPNGTINQVQLPLLLDVPVCFMGGGGGVLTFPLAAGDECLYVIADRCIDGWFQLGGVQPQTDLRLHDLSDGFAIIGPRSLARALTGVSTTTAQFRSLDGTTYYEINPTSKVINVVAPGGINFVSPTLMHNDVDVGYMHAHPVPKAAAIGSPAETGPPNE